jgi:dienelactone hydrolase
MRQAVYRNLALALVVLGAGFLRAQGADDPAAGKLEASLRELEATVLPAEAPDAPPPRQQLARHIRADLDAANRRETQAWQAVQTRSAWEEYRDVRIKALRESLGTFPPPPTDLKVQVTGTINGTGYSVEKLVFVSRPGLVVTADLYRPETPGRSMPGILICHSHHNPKTEGELQDMGVLWARLGCLVLVMDQLGHGERRQHPFVDAKSYPRPFRVGRQDYYFRYNVGLQLHLAGESLAGWMAWDLMRGVDLLLARPGIDKDRIILLGAVAGGGDPAAVAAALDHRIRAVVPFNFGGPQPETTYPLPDKAERNFNYAGSGSWESTRNLRLSARDGFLPWVIVGAAAPRGLVYAHEFSWDREHDPVWARLGKLYDWYGAADRLASVHGKGRVTGKPPEASHCNNIGPLQRQGIYDALKRWFDIPAPPEEAKDRHSAAELACLSPDLAKQLGARPVHRLAAEVGAERSAAARRRLPEGAAERREPLRRAWGPLLGAVEPAAEIKIVRESKERVGDIAVERIGLEVDRGVHVPLLLLVPAHAADERPPVVVAFAQEGKQALLKGRAGDVADLLRGGVAVCLPDLRGTGETHPGDGRGRMSTATGLASTRLMLGGTLLGERLRDLRSVLRYLRGRRDLDARRLALWGDSFAPPNPEDRETAVPLDADPLPDQSEPLGGLLALFGGLFEDVQAVCARGGLIGYASLLDSPFVYVPYDAVVPGALTAGDLNDVAAALAPRPLRLEGLVNGVNQLAGTEALALTLEPVLAAYRSAPERLQFLRKAPESDPPGRWLLARLRGR